MDYQELLEEIDFFIEHKHCVFEHEKLKHLKKTVIFLKDKNLSQNTADRYIESIQKWKPKDICLSALGFGLQAYVVSKIKKHYAELI